MEGEGRVLQQIGPVGFYARVWVACQDECEPSVRVTLEAQANDPWQQTQGWTDAALAGAALGLKIAGRTMHCTVKRIHGMPCDTNPTLVAIAAIRAVWAALAFEPSETLAKRIDDAIRRRSTITVANLEQMLR
jgi:hypothetical protein